MKEKILFILKFREDSGGQSYAYHYFSSGLFWSAKFVTDMLVRQDVDVKLVEVIDNNDIDREVAAFKPDIVVIEALWVVPEKFDILKKLHPDVQWVVRIHSDMPFIANEGIAISWVKGYIVRDVTVAANDKRMVRDLESITDSEIVYLPNYYPMRSKIEAPQEDDDVIRIGCFGAIRPLKNQLIQAVAAIRFADSIGKTLEFHINGTRVEMTGFPVLQNIRALFQNTSHKLVEHGWMSHQKFISILGMMDIGMQVSLSETFSIVTADMVSAGVPVVVSPEIQWASFLSKSDPTNSEEIADKLGLAYFLSSVNVAANRHGLKSFSQKSKQEWLKFLNNRS